ncbi:hypothetical protein ACS0TY_020493 [Phlomoides rotata]
MADEKKKQPLSLNQLHNRFLLSASQAKTKTMPVDDSSQSKAKLEKEFDDCPSFDFYTPSPPPQGEVNVEESGTKLNDSSPRLFAGIADFDSPPLAPASVPPEHNKITEEEDYSSDNFLTASVPPEHTKISEEEDNSSETGPTISHSGEKVDVGLSHIELESSEISDVNVANKESSLSGLADFESNIPGEEKIKVRIEGRRRLCRISKNSDDAGAEKVKSDEEPKLDGISDFDSPLPTNKTCESSGNEIRDILNDLSSRLEFLSIEKKKVPKKTHVMEDFQESQQLKSKLYDVTVKDGLHEYQSASSSHLAHSYSPEDTIESRAGGAINRKKQTSCADVGVGKTDRNIYKREEVTSKKPTRAHGKSGFANEQPYTYRRAEKIFGTDKYAFLSEHQGNVIEVSDEESDVEDFILSGFRSAYKLTGKIANMLYPHQREGLKWLWSLHCKGKGGILGDDMGLGKTMQICSFLAGLFHSNLIRRVLIVAPKTLLTHWIKELSTVGLSEKTREYFSTSIKTRDYELQYVLQDKGILLTTYDIVRNNANALRGDQRYNDDWEEEEITWNYMILDEGHLIKNPSTQRAKSLLQIPCRHRIIISGTPLQNNLKELWALFNFCCPELLGNYKEFKERYEHFINRGNEKNASDREKRIGSSVAKDLRDYIQPYFLRRLKSEVFQDDTTLSKKNEIIVWLRLTQCQRQLYEAFLKSEIVLSAFDGSPLAAITILKKICDHPLLLTKRAAEDVLEGMDSIVGQEDHHVAEKLAMHIADVAERFDIVENNDISCKISFILSLLGDLIPKGHNVLIFSQTRKMLNLIQESLMSTHYKYMRIDGTTKITDRAKIVKEFQEGSGATIFLLTTQVGGLGLTLTNADRVIVVDPAWNPSTDNQSVDRAYRIGQKKDVIVYRLMTCSTVEEKIYRKQVFKGGLFKSATEHKEQIRYFSQQDLKDLFSLPKHGFDVSLTQQQLLEEHDQQHTMEESLKTHVEFLQTLNIAGVSQHSLLFSKAAPVQDVKIEDEAGRLKGTSSMGYRHPQSSLERNVDGAKYAFNPKDVKKVHKNTSPDVREVEPSELEIRERINRLSQIYSNQTAVSRLPDKGEKIHKHIDSLKLMLDQMRIAKEGEHDVIEL